MAAKAQDYTKAFNDFVGAFPIDLSAYQDAFKTSAALNEKIASVALDAAEKSNEVSSKWAQDTLAKRCDCRCEKSDGCCQVRRFDFRSTALLPDGRRHGAGLKRPALLFFAALP